jgi:PAS domain S-box-containing protein
MATVLVVDDDMINRELLRALLSHHGHRALTAINGLDALEVARREHPDVVIADVLMPGMDGYELARRLRDEPTTNGTPIAFYTAHYAEHEVRSLADACGVQRVIQKPSKPAALLEALDELLARGPAPPREVTDEEFAREHLDTLKAKLVEKAAALNRSEGRFRIIAESAPVGILLGDAQGVAIYVNPRFCEITRRSRADLLGAGWLDYVEAAHRQDVLAALVRGPLDGHYRHRVRLARGTDSPLWLDVHLRPVTDSGQRAGFVGLFEDVTLEMEAQARERAERAREAELQRHTARLAHRLTEAQRVARMGTWDLDLDTDLVTTSAELRDILGLGSSPSHRSQFYGSLIPTTVTGSTC